MNTFLFHHAGMLALLWLLPAFAALLVYARWRRRCALRAFAEAAVLGRLPTSASAPRRAWKAAALLTAVAALVVALARPAWNPEPETIERRGRDVVFVLDVSRSMLAEDLRPNRLERAKLAIRDCIDVIAGDRVALVAFAGSAAVKCPLTHDYGFFRMVLDEIDASSIARGGTMIGDALRKTLDEAFDEGERGQRDIILITDGEDHESFPVEAAQEAGRRGIRLIAVGLGDGRHGATIPSADEHGRRGPLTHRGEVVRTRLDADTLRRMVDATPGGRYIPVATGAIELGSVYTDLVASAEKTELGTETMIRYEEKFQAFLALAFALLCIDGAIGERAGSVGKR